MIRSSRPVRGAADAPRARLRTRPELVPEVVVRVADQAERNRLITRSYWEISRRLRDLLGRDAGANWCTFAAWASRRAGRTIRGEDCHPIIGWLFYGLTLGDLDRGRARVAAAEGNLKVYREIAPQFVRFLRRFAGRPAPQPDRLEAFLRPLRSGQRLLRYAFRNYYRALYAPNARARQGYTFLANLQAALHEQTRLQDAIARALPRTGRLRRWTTSAFLALPLPGGASAPVARPVPGPAARRLRRIDNPETLALMRRFGADGPRPAAASDWADLAQRMRFIIRLMRVRHDDPALFAVPE